MPNFEVTISTVFRSALEKKMFINIARCHCHYSLCLGDDSVHDFADVLQIGDERLLVDGVLLQLRQDVLQPE